MENKLEKLKSLLTLIQNDTVTPTTLKKFLEMVIGAVNKSKDEFNTISREQLNTIDEAIALIEKRHKESSNLIDSETRAINKNFDKKFATLKKLIKKIKTIKPKNGKDGIDGITPVKGVDYWDGVDGLPGSPDNREDIIKKINKGGDRKIKATEIKGLPEFTREVVREVGSVGHIETQLKAGSNITITTDSSGGKVISSTGGVSKVGTPADNQIGVWTGDGTLEGDSNFTWDGSSFTTTSGSNSIVLTPSGTTAITITDTSAGSYNIIDVTNGANNWKLNLSSAGQFQIRDHTGTANVFKINPGGTVGDFHLLGTGQLTLGRYGDGTITGSVTKLLGVDIDGNIIETNVGFSELNAKLVYPAYLG